MGSYVEAIMTRAKAILASLALSLVAACGDPTLLGGNTERPLDVEALPPMKIASYTVSVPDTLTVSEANSYDPSADIVWRGDPFGPRLPQVQAVFETGIKQARSSIEGEIPVRLEVVVQRFHSQTQKTRYSYGGRYEIEYDLTVLNSTTGDVIIPRYRVYANSQAPGGIEALAAEQAGRTEKVDNINLIASSVFIQLTGRQPTGFEPLTK